MVEKVEISDVSKLRPELLELSEAELNRRITEMQMALEVRKKKADEEARKKLVDDAGVHVEQILEGLKFLHENGFLPDSVREFFTTGKGLFLPHLKLKAPRS